MKITVFTSNQPRHLALVHRLAEQADEVFAVQECTTAFPGQVDDFYRKTQVMQDYFTHVIASERKVFGDISFHPKNVRSLALKMGDLSNIALSTLSPALDSDYFVVFGASWIRGTLADAVIERKAVNLHMGLSPYYRGTACNFWAMYDRRPELVGGTVHLLSKGLDSGPIYATATPPMIEAEPFDLGMLAVKETHILLADMIASGLMNTIKPLPQDASKEIRYTRNRDFTDAIASEYLAQLMGAKEILTQRMSSDGAA